MDWDLKSSSARRFWLVELASLALATSRSACAWAMALRALRGSTLTNDAPRLTICPVSAFSCRISPEALDFTSTVVSGCTAPEAWADTTMSRRSTGTAS